MLSAGRQQKQEITNEHNTPSKLLTIWADVTQPQRGTRRRRQKSLLREVSQRGLPSLHPVNRSVWPLMGAEQGVGGHFHTLRSHAAFSDLEQAAVNSERRCLWQLIICVVFRKWHRVLDWHGAEQNLPRQTGSDLEGGRHHHRHQPSGRHRRWLDRRRVFYWPLNYHLTLTAPRYIIKFVYSHCCRSCFSDCQLSPTCNTEHFVFPHRKSVLDGPRR